MHKYKKHPNKSRAQKVPKVIPFEVLMKRFKKATERSGIIQEVKKREFFEKPTWKKRRKKKEAIARHKRSLPQTGRKY